MGRCPCFGSWKWRTRLRPDDEDGDGESRTSAGDDDVDKDGTAPCFEELIGAVELEDGSLGLLREDPKEKGHKKARTFNYRELATATRDFREESILGKGGFGTVYWGRLRDSGQELAVKQLNKAGRQGEKEFSVEVLMLSHLQHRNLVNLLGYCAEGDQRLLVYEYMPSGSLEVHLHDLAPDVVPLDWNTRMRIAAGAARGLNYLHNEAETPVIYRDLKSSNILLDNGFHPKLSDFGFAKFGPVGDHTHVSTRVMGTQGYCAPEYGLSGKLTMKTDVYSFGVVLLELITGRRAVELVDGHAEYLVEWARPRIKDRQNIAGLADPKLHGQFMENILRRVANVAGMCVREDPGSRPSIKEVMLALEYLALKKFDHVATHGNKGNDPESSPKETMVLMSETKNLLKEFEREQAVAEAKQWGETWREKRRQIGGNFPNTLDR